MASYENVLPESCDYRIEKPIIDREPNTGRDGVYIVVNKKTGQRKILKYFHSDKYGPSNPNEVAIASTLSHPNIIQTDLLISHQYCNVKGLGEIVDFAQKTYTKYIPTLQSLNQKVASILRILYAIQFMHRNGYLHLDIKYDNIVVLNGVECVTDFGNAVRCRNVKKGITLNLGIYSGTLTYLPPEVIKKRPTDPITYNSAVDVWALGHLFHAIFFNSIVHDPLVYSGFKDPIVRESIFQTNIQLENPEYVTQLIRQKNQGKYTEQVTNMLITLFTSIWKQNPNERPSVTQLINFPLFNIVKVPAPEGKIYQMGITLSVASSKNIEKYLSLIVGFGKNFQLTSLSVAVLTTAVDLYYRTYYRTIGLGQFEDRVRTSLAYACCYVSLRCHTLSDMNVYDRILAVIGENEKYFSEMISDIYISVHGDVNRYSYYNLCEGANHVKVLFQTYIFNPALYIKSDFARFKNEIVDTIPADRSPEMTISELSAYMSGKIR